MEAKINNGRDECIIGKKGISHFEKKYNATYVADLCLKDKNGNWTNEPAAIFYQETPPVPGYSHYFAILVRGNKAIITNGESAVSEPIIGIQADNGEIIFSRYRNDFRQSQDKSVFIDGGRDYIKHNNPERLVEINIVDGKMFFTPFKNELIPKKPKI
jgi:hypothetical protein